MPHGCILQWKVERSKMLCRGRCCSAYYCSRARQKAAWSEHREECKENAEENAKFEVQIGKQGSNKVRVEYSYALDRFTPFDEDASI